MVSPTLALFSSLLAASSALAHMQMSWPYPLHSSLNPATPEADKDYSMTSPLVTDGTYPCKGFITTADDMGSNAEWSAGSTINYTLVGTATHGGGSCQLSMSYDLGETWSVIFSQIGGCPDSDSLTTDVTIPSDAPSGQALFAWGWFNLQGNREMYHNCAPVTITNGGSGLTNTDDYPTPFVANADVNDCVTIENTAVVFPNPGKTVVYGGDYSSSQPTEAAGFTGSNCVGPNASSSNSSSSASSSASSSGAATEASTAASESTAASGVSASAGIPVSLSASLGVGENAQATSSSSYVDASSSSYVDASSPSSVSVSAATASATTTSSSTSSSKSCKAKRALKAANEARARHVRRAPKRFAASKASHSSSKRDVSPEAVVEKRGGKRHAASKASHASAEKRTEGAGFEGRAGVKKSAASPRDVKRGLVGRGIFETSS
ncbi:hypothetical protein L202_01757 [Cryptococcus amylolentus CBS 6039]|uniref:Chitin-binding type-4 domain-containing protein n=1 Tax=Cryptococcus amylolentus CBS 6039 TaxID=1295533 RepID=A0A1E3I4U4_9TREE|nr:hypothetical protein L202_01757 [Cryptococcus amylolentus CBS 6039]ODN83660.1 hypothetical protein L202_01757 [Cryptococcus amylolentus CBS 6039]